MSSSTSTAPYPLAALRAVALRVQRLNLSSSIAAVQPNGTKSFPTSDHIAGLVEHLGCLQLDTLQKVHRAHYLTVWSRLGTFQPGDLDCLVYHPQERYLFEGWQHASCLVPLRDWRFQLPHMRRLQANPATFTGSWLRSEENRTLLEEVERRVRLDGPLLVADFKYQGPKRGSWWDWKPAKMALEHLTSIGVLMIADRLRFQRVYDLTERVLPAWVDRSEPTAEERDRFWLEQRARLLGVATLSQVAGYYYMKKDRAAPHLEKMLQEKTLVPLQGILANGKTGPLVVHRQNLPLLEQAVEGQLESLRTTFLNPFDNLFWAKGRDLALWGFHQTLEAYRPAPVRTWGYFCLPILHRDRLVGRFDPKLERKDGILRLVALYLEPKVEPEEELVGAVAEAMRDFLRFHQAKELVIERSDPPIFASKLKQAL
ncbi:MAG: winged helix DNA-binding domain-containing protein [Coprothermobacterota bacterium]|nr:winged helix DNA-binding domain-containing protein [Coprothermobacterota bacterium]